jgi:hypothetical protein
VLVSAVFDNLNAFNIGLPCTVGVTHGVGNVAAEGNTFAADTALCHYFNLLWEWKIYHCLYRDGYYYSITGRGKQYRKRFVNKKFTFWERRRGGWDERTGAGRTGRAAAWRANSVFCILLYLYTVVRGFFGDVDVVGVGLF